MMLEIIEEWPSGKLAKRLARNLATQQQAHDVAVNVLGLDARDLDQPLIWHTDRTVIRVRDMTTPADTRDACGICGRPFTDASDYWRAATGETVHMSCYARLDATD